MKMLGFVLIFIVIATLGKAQEGEVIIPSNKTQCMNDMIEWCNSMQYPQQSAGLAILSIVYENPNGYYRVSCSSDADGTNCTRNNTIWFTCSPDHVLYYKGQILSNKTSENDIDDDICATADAAFNEIFVQNLSYKNMTLKEEVQKGMEAFFNQVAIMQEQIEIIQRFLRSLPYIGDLYDLLYREDADVEDYSPFFAPNDRNKTPIDQTNQIERE